ncbi:hypothetical protein Tco_0943906 [Tanacetum coccineum]
MKATSSIVKQDTRKCGGRMKLQELIDLCTKLSDKVLDLENVKDAQALEIQKLKKRVKKLERSNAIPNHIENELTKKNGIFMVFKRNSETQRFALQLLLLVKSVSTASQKKKDQIKYDADVAHRLQAELDKEARLEREREEEASKAPNIAE